MPKLSENLVEKQALEKAKKEYLIPLIDALIVLRKKLGLNRVALAKETNIPYQSLAYLEKSYAGNLTHLCILMHFFSQKGVNLNTLLKPGSLDEELRNIQDKQSQRDELMIE